MFWCYKQLNLSLVFFYNFYKFLISWKLVDILSDTHGPTLNWEFLWLNVLCFKYFHVFLFCLNPKECTSETSVQQRKQLENILNSCPQSLHLHKTHFFLEVLKIHLQDQYFIQEPYNIVLLEISFQIQPLQFLLYLLQILPLPPDLFLSHWFIYL